MKVTSTEFKARCLEMMERVRRTRRPLTMTKRGRIVAQLAPPPPEEARAWRRLRGSATHVGDVVSPVVDKRDVRALR
ncbi:MAG: type II toxin-antitoxin system prevent-host-death family antitoxin [Candidatus Binatia bacterium]